MIQRMIKLLRDGEISLGKNERVVEGYVMSNIIYGRECWRPASENEGKT